MNIRLVLVHSEIFIFDAEDCATLRKDYRIVGNFVGSLNSLPALPLKLIPEEVHLLLEKKIAVVVKYINQSHNDSLEFRSSLLREQRILYKNNRRQYLEKKLDDIVASKRKKGDTREELEIFNDELNKSSTIQSDKMIWPIMPTPFPSQTESVNFIPEMKNYLRYSIYKDLWERGYYITSGEKFGGDFLVYKDDPLTYHAIFIVRCIKETEIMLPSEITAFGRLATAVKKRAVLASLVNDEVSYITVSWIDD